MSSSIAKAQVVAICHDLSCHQLPTSPIRMVHRQCNAWTATVLLPGRCGCDGRSPWKPESQGCQWNKYAKIYEICFFNLWVLTDFISGRLNGSIHHTESYVAYEWRTVFYAYKFGFCACPCYHVLYIHIYIYILYILILYRFIMCIYTYIHICKTISMYIRKNIYHT